MLENSEWLLNMLLAMLWLISIALNLTIPMFLFQFVVGRNWDKCELLANQLPEWQSTLFVGGWIYGCVYAALGLGWLHAKGLLQVLIQLWVGWKEAVADPYFSIFYWYWGVYLLLFIFCSLLLLCVNKKVNLYKKTTKSIRLLLVSWVMLLPLLILLSLGD